MNQTFYAIQHFQDRVLPIKSATSLSHFRHLIWHYHRIMVGYQLFAKNRKRQPTWERSELGKGRLTYLFVRAFVPAPKHFSISHDPVSFARRVHVPRPRAGSSAWSITLKLDSSYRKTSGFAKMNPDLGSTAVTISSALGYGDMPGPIVARKPQQSF